MSEKVLVPGGAGFIGSHVVDLLLEQGFEPRVFDSLEKQVHGDIDYPPSYLSPEAEFIRGDIRDADAVARALEGVSAVVHLAAAVGVAQSQYEISHYVNVNDFGTAVLLEQVSRRRDSINKVIVASSMSIYGEGSYKCGKCGPVAARTRTDEQLERHEWELLCPECGSVLKPSPTSEEKKLFCESVYALTKKDTEELALILGRAYDIPSVALRFFNTYGPRQALSNPYTGLLAIVSSRMINGNPALIFEDGKQSRDFVHVRDVARSCLAALKWKGRGTITANIGTGKQTSVLDVVEAVRKGLDFKEEPQVVNRFRSGDIRHCYADTSRAKDMLDFKAEIDLKKGVEDLLAWVREETSKDLVKKAVDELEGKGLVK